MKPWILYLSVYIAAVSLIGFSAMGIDKQKAKKGKWRIPEKTLFLLAILGGSLGTTLGMHVFHHKTRHWYFRFGMPAILLLQIVFAAYMILCF